MRISQLVYLFAQVSLAIFNWLILTILAKKFGKHLVGEYSVILAWLTPIFLLYSLQIKSRFLTSLELNLNKIIGIRLVLVVPLVLVSSLLLFVDYPIKIVAGVFILKLGEVLFEIPFMKDQKEGNLFRASYIQLFKNICVYSVILLLSSYLEDFGFAVIAGGILSIISSTFYFFASKIKVNLNFDLKLFKTFLPLGGAAFITSFIVSIPRLYLKKIIGVEAVAVYTVVFSFYAIWQLLFNNYFTGVLNNMHKMNILKLIRLPIIVFSLSALIFSLFDKEIYNTLFGLEFIDASKYTYLLLLNIFISFWCSLSYYQLLIKNDYKSQIKINGVLALSSIIIMPFSIIKFQVYGAFGAQLIIQFIQLVLYRRHLKR